MRQAIGIRLFFALIDVFCLLASFTLVYYLRQHLFPIYFGGSLKTVFTPYVHILLFICTMWLLAALRAGLLSLREMTFEEEVVRIFSALGTILILLLLLLTMLKANYNYSRIVIFGGIIVSFFTITLARTFVRRQLEKIEISKRNVLLISGCAKLPEPVLRHLQSLKTHSNLAGLVLPKRSMGKEKSIPINARELRILGSIDDLDCIVRQYNIEQVHIVLYKLTREESEHIASSVEGLMPFITIHPDPTDILVANSEVTVQAGAINLCLRQNLVNPMYRAAKRVFDVLFSLVVLVFFSPLYLLIALAIRLDSPGPIFFIQKRMGQGREVFGCRKFRTMAIDAEERLQRLFQVDIEAKREFERDFKLKNDPRVTRVGRWLRKTSLDELPQFINVLQGTMSVVGPRPIVENEVEKYKRWDNLLFRAKPGITGLWQVSGRNDVSYEERVMFDRYYIKNWSFSLDAMIIVKTIFTILYRQGAY